MAEVDRCLTKARNLDTPWATAPHEFASDNLAPGASKGGVVSAVVKVVSLVLCAKNQARCLLGLADKLRFGYTNACVEV